MYARNVELSVLARFRPAAALVGALLLSACGGGGGGDGGPVATPTLSVTGASTVEGNSGNSDLVFTVTASIAVPTDVSVDYATSDGTATSPDDYVATSGTLSIPAGSNSATVAVPVVGDTDVEADETLTLTLSNVSASAVIGTATVTGTITNDDTAPPTLSIADASVTEGNGGTTDLSFSVALSGAAASDVTVDYATADGSAIAPDDYAAASGSVTIAAGSTAASIDVTIVGDTVDEASETLTVTLSNVSAAATLGTATATGTIVDDDGVAATGMRLNDTGFVACTSDAGYDFACSDAGTGTDQFPGQDAEHGRDVTNNDNADGHAGFSFTKLDAAGAPLADQSANYATNPWDCVRDEVTGLTWEIKTSAEPEDLHDSDYVYSWYNSSGINDGGDPGVSGGGECFDNDRCDTEKFAEDVSAESYCGFNDWRMPTRTELLSLVDYSADYQPVIAGWKTAFIDATYFPNTNMGHDYWTSSSGGWSAEKRVIAFDGNPSRSESAFRGLAARLVRGGN